MTFPNLQFEHLNITTHILVLPKDTWQDLALLQYRAEVLQQRLAYGFCQAAAVLCATNISRMLILPLSCMTPFLSSHNTHQKLTIKQGITLGTGVLYKLFILQFYSSLRMCARNIKADLKL